MWKEGGWTPSEVAEHFHEVLGQHLQPVGMPAHPLARWPEGRLIACRPIVVTNIDELPRPSSPDERRPRSGSRTRSRRRDQGGGEGSRYRPCDVRNRQLTARVHRSNRVRCGGDPLASRSRLPHGRVRRHRSGSRSQLLQVDQRAHRRQGQADERMPDRSRQRTRGGVRPVLDTAFGVPLGSLLPRDRGERASRVQRPAFSRGSTIPHR